MNNSNNIYSQRITSLALFIFIVASFVYCYQFFLQFAPSAMTSALMHDFSISATSLGLLSSSFYWTYTAMQIPAGLLLDRYGARLMLTVVLFVCSIGAAIFGMAHGLDLAVVGRILMGASGAFAFTGVLYLIIRWFPANRMAMFLGVVQLLGCVGGIAGSSLMVELLEFYNWRSIMIVFMLLGIVMSVIIWAVVRNNPPKVEIKEEQRPSMLKALLSVVRKSQTWWIALYSFAVWGPIVAFAALWGLPFIRVSEKVSSIKAAAAIAFVWVGLAIVSPAVGWMSDRFKRRCWFTTGPAFIGLISSVIMIYVPNLPMIILYILLFLLGISGGGQILVFALVKDNNQVNTTGAANGLNNMAVVLGGAFLPILIGELLDVNWQGFMMNGTHIYGLHEFQIALSVLPACYLLGTLVSIFFIKETYCKSVYEQDMEEIS